MNELFFFSHILILFLAILIAKRIGKEALIALIALQVILANLFVTKQILLFSLPVTATDAYTVGSLVAMNLLQEYFGKECVKKVLSLNIFLLLFFTLMSLIQMIYLPSSHDAVHTAFSSILSTTPRIFLASIFSFYLSQKIDVELFSFLRKRFSLPLSMLVSLGCSQAIDTVTFSYLALYGIAYSMASIILMSYLIKLITLVTMTPLTIFLRKRHEI